MVNEPPDREPQTLAHWAITEKQRRRRAQLIRRRNERRRAAAAAHAAALEDVRIEDF